MTHLREIAMEKDVQDTLNRIEARLEAIEKLGKQLKEDLAEASSNVLASGQMSGADRKLDEILQILKAEE
jgi:prefoldin subunit 5